MESVDIIWTKLDGSITLEILALLLALILVLIIFRSSIKPDILGKAKEFLSKTDKKN